jgi:glycosyltransferase involved in cell wall biosynthesis
MILNKKNDTVILFVGRLDNTQKNIKYLIKMSKYLEYDVHVFGDGRYLDLIKKNPNKIKYHGTFSACDKSKIYSNYKYVVCVSKFEGFPYVLTESLYYGTPILVRDTFDSAAFLTNDDRNGLLINKNLSCKKCADKINKYINNNQNNYVNLSRNTINFSKTTLSNNKFVESWIKIFDKHL